MIDFTGDSYDQSTESDILLLDINNNEEYIWTNNFEPINLPPLATLTLTTSPSSAETSSAIQTAIIQQPDKLNNKLMIGAIVGALFSGALLSFGGFFLY